MLRRLTIQAFALVDHVDLDFGKGLTVFLGETGAGKSIIIDALSIALGERASGEIVRKGQKKAIVEASFSDGTAPLHEFLQEHELAWEYPEIVIRREISATGTSRCFVNDTPTQLPVVRELAAFLIDFHGQHDTHGLLASKSHREILDRFAGIHAELRSDMKRHWDEFKRCEDRLVDITRRAHDADADRARLSFLRDEISSVNPLPDEDVLVSQELRRAESQEHVVSAAMRVRDALYASERSAYDLLRESRDLLNDLATFDSSLTSVIGDVESALIICKEAAGAVAPLADPDAASPERIEELRQRVALLQRLVRKYGSIEAALEQQDRVQAELSLLENLDEAINQAQKARDNAQSNAESVALQIRHERASHAEALSEAVQSSLRDMGMPSSTFNISLQPTSLGPLGADTVEFLFSSNPGEPPRQLSKVASGGELSRLMLSMKRALSVSASYGTMVFDEIDTGISGRIARIVGDIMKSISTSQQIVCITHLPQIASLADQFVRITKDTNSDTTTVHAQNITDDEALVEVAKLLSGDNVSDVSLSGARELMKPRSRAASR